MYYNKYIITFLLQQEQHHIGKLFETLKLFLLLLLLLLFYFILFFN